MIRFSYNTILCYAVNELACAVLSICCVFVPCFMYFLSSSLRSVFDLAARQISKVKVEAENTKPKAHTTNEMDCPHQKN